MQKHIFLFLLLTLIGLPIKSRATEQSPRALVHLLDYLAQDYGGAVGTDGKVVNASEFKEQLEFAKRAIETNSTLNQTKNFPEIQTGLIKLQALIQSKKSPKDVAETAQRVKTRIIEVSGIEVAPIQFPVLAQGASLYQKNCVSCHGPQGKGDGIAAGTMNPKPADFWDVKRMKNLAPFKVFNGIRIGVPGTAMEPFPTLTDKDAWALAFYVLSLRNQWAASEVKNLKQPDSISLKDLAVSTDEQLEKLVKGATDQEKKKMVAILRSQTGSENLGNTLAIARTYLSEALENYKNGNYEVAKNRALMAYLEGVEPIEFKLRASDPAIMIKLENQMGLVRQSIDGRKSLSQVTGTLESAFSQIDVADTLLNSAPASPSLTFTVAAAILLREGFEAVLIIIALLGVLKASGSNAAARWIHGGWIAALACGALAWIFSGWLIGISGAQREMMEGVTSLIAVGVLLYMGFWLHSKTESGRWRTFINDRVNAALEKKNLMGLALISFTAVFREAFETVLFLRALWIEGGMASKTAMVSGVLSALALILILSWTFLKYSANIPIKKLFDFSSSLMGVLSVVLIGKGMHALQETGLVSITASPLNIRIDLIGFYPTLETTLAQVLVLGFAMGLWMYGKKPSRFNDDRSEGLVV